jgi:nucleotide-binding universal stress UspA family protein
MNKRKLIWAVDPSQSPAEATKMVSLMRAWSNFLECKIQPVTIFPKLTLTFPIELDLPWEGRFEELAVQSVENFLKKYSGADMDFLKPIFIPSVSTRNQATALAQFAEKNEALAIFASTRARKSWNPFRLGSFTETLVAISRVPVFALNPQAKVSLQFSSVLFPTDFSHESKMALQSFLPWAKKQKAKVIFYNQVEAPHIFPSEATGAWPAFDMEKLMESAEANRKKKARDWVKWINSEGVKGSFIIQSERETLAEDIIRISKLEKVDLIAMATTSGPIAQSLLGSVARDVLLQAKIPVVIFHRPKLLRKSLRNSEKKIKNHFQEGAKNGTEYEIKS